MEPKGLEEDQIPNNYNEIDINGDPETSLLRNIVNFKLYNDEGQLISFADLGEGKPLGTLVGDIIEPLPTDAKQRMIDLSCTVKQQLEVPERLGEENDPAEQSSEVTVNPSLIPWFETGKYYEDVSYEDAQDVLCSDVFNLFLCFFSQLYIQCGNQMPPLKRCSVVIKGIEDW